MFRTMLLNRFTLVFGSLALLIVAWNLYVATHAGGRLTGTVIDREGRPVADATVALGRKTVTSVDSLTQARTDGQGHFRFDKHGQYWVVLTASKPGVGTSARRMLPLWFRNQDAEVDQPLVLVAATADAAQPAGGGRGLDMIESCSIRGSTHHESAAVPHSTRPLQGPAGLTGPCAGPGIDTRRRLESSRR